MSVPLILTILAGVTFIGAMLYWARSPNRVLAFSLGFAAGIMPLIS